MIWATSWESLISAFVVHCLDSIIPLVSISEISSLNLPSVAAQAGLSINWLQTPKTGFLLTRLIRFWRRLAKSIFYQINTNFPDCHFSGLL